MADQIEQKARELCRELRLYGVAIKGGVYVSEESPHAVELLTAALREPLRELRRKALLRRDCLDTMAADPDTDVVYSARTLYLERKQELEQFLIWLDELGGGDGS